MENKKIRNATPTEYNGVKYRSKLEAKFARMLDVRGIAFDYEKEKWTLLEKQRYMGETIRCVQYTPDFIIGDIVVEVKGFRNDVFPLKRKLIIKYINERRPDLRFFEVKNERDMNAVIILILNKNMRTDE